MTIDDLSDEAIEAENARLRAELATALARVKELERAAKPPGIRGPVGDFIGDLLVGVAGGRINK